jgi:antitoxin ParD1/3/4
MSFQCIYKRRDCNHKVKQTLISIKIILAIFAIFCQNQLTPFSWISPMATMNISLPDQLRDWVQSQITAGTYASSSDYVRDLIRRDQENRKIQILQNAITDGLNSGISNLSIDDLLKEARTKLQASNAD